MLEVIGNILVSDQEVHEWKKILEKLGQMNKTIIITLHWDATKKHKTNS